MSCVVLVGNACWTEAATAKKQAGLVPRLVEIQRVSYHLFLERWQEAADTAETQHTHAE